MLITKRDVEVNLLEPLLNSMGWHEHKDYIRQLPIHAGRGHRIFPDYALHYNNKLEEENAKVLIEAKYYMKNNQVDRIGISSGILLMPNFCCLM